jgi:hypothetical protein
MNKTSQNMIKEDRTSEYITVSKQLFFPNVSVALLILGRKRTWMK